MITFTLYTEADYPLVKDYLSKKEIEKYTNRGGHKLLSLFGISKDRFYLLKDDNRLLGCRVIRYKYSRELHRKGWWFYSLWVVPEERCKGYGSIIHQKTLETVKALGAKEVFLTVKNDNDNAIRLDYRMGYQKVKQCDGYMVMGKDLR